MQKEYKTDGFNVTHLGKTQLHFDATLMFQHQPRKR
jgi:hypothetical protein